MGMAGFVVSVAFTRNRSQHRRKAETKSRRLNHYAWARLLESLKDCRLVFAALRSGNPSVA